MLAWVTELSKEDGKRDFDAMAKLVSDYEQLADKGTIGWALGRIQSISPTINSADQKLNKVIEAVRYKYKRMTDFVLDEHELRNSSVFKGSGDDDDDDCLPFEEGEAGYTALSNINYVH